MTPHLLVGGCSSGGVTRNPLTVRAYTVPCSTAHPPGRQEVLRRGTDIRIGRFLVTDDDAVLHGPLEMGDRVFLGENAVVFRARLGDDVQVGEGAIVVGPEAPGDKIALEIPDDTLIPAGAAVTSKRDVRALKR